VRYGLGPCTPPCVRAAVLATAVVVPRSFGYDLYSLIRAAVALTLFPYTTLFRSAVGGRGIEGQLRVGTARERGLALAANRARELGRGAFETLQAHGDGRFRVLIHARHRTNLRQQAAGAPAPCAQRTASSCRVRRTGGTHMGELIHVSKVRIVKD